RPYEDVQGGFQTRPYDVRDTGRNAPTHVDSPAGRLTLSGCSEGSSGQGAESSPTPSWGTREKPFEPDPGHAGEGTGQSVPSLPCIRPAEPNAAFVECRGNQRSSWPGLSRPSTPWPPDERRGCAGQARA